MVMAWGEKLMTRNHDRSFGLIDRSTGDAARHIDRPYTLVTMFPGEPLERWNFVMRVPVGIDRVLNSADWEEVTALFQKKGYPPFGLSPFETLLLAMKAKGKSSAELKDTINKGIAKCLYNKFVQHQIKSGNSAWLTPRSMTNTKGEPR